MQMVSLKMKQGCARTQHHLQKQTLECHGRSQAEKPVCAHSAYECSGDIEDRCLDLSVVAHVSVLLRTDEMAQAVSQNDSDTSADPTSASPSRGVPQNLGPVWCLLFAWQICQLTAHACQMVFCVSQHG
jgi:hypothetical protein